MTFKKSKILLSVFAIILISITMYKLTVQDAITAQLPQQTSSEAQYSSEQTVTKDPFKEALEKQTQAKLGQQTLSQSVQGSPNRDPFKEFLDKQGKELGQSKVSPFDTSVGR
jgi:primase-polymerase (primpol)-like protein